MRDRVLPREAAERLLCSTRRIERWIQAGKLPKGVDGKVAFAKARQLNLSQKTGRPSGRLPRNIKEFLSQFSRKERAIVQPFLQPTHGQRRFERMIDALALAARNWTPAKRKRWAEKLSDASDRVKRTEPTERRERERKRLPEVEFIPFFLERISPEDEKYVLLEARDPFEFLRRAKERGLRVEIESSERANDRRLSKGYRQYDKDGSRLPDEAGYTPDISAEIDYKNQSSGQRDTAEDILATYAAITGAAEKRRFLLANKSAIRAARMSAAKRTNYEHMLNIVERKKCKWVKIDDGHTFKSVPA